MNIKSFLSLVEIRTKVASVIPFILGTIYALYRFNTFNLANFFLMLGALLLIDMTTTALNNYFDFRRARKKHGYNYETHNAIVRYQLKEVTVVATIVFMISVAVLLGIILTVNTDIVVILIGALSFAIGVCYSFGPVPISRTPLGELFSGFFMGFLITFLSVYIHIYDRSIVLLGFQNTNLMLQLNYLEIVYIFLLSIPTVCCIANIMLANNICDISDDIQNRRYTLPIYIGKRYSLWLFAGLYCIAYADIVILVILKLVPAICILTILTAFPVYKNLKLFFAVQSKKETFPLCIKNFFLIVIPFIILFGIVLVRTGI